MRQRRFHIERLITSGVMAVCAASIPQLGPGRFALAVTIVVTQTLTTLVFRHRIADPVNELGVFLTVDHVLGAVAPLFATLAWVPSAIVAIYSIGVNAAFLTRRWVLALAAVTVVGFGVTAWLLAPPYALPVVILLIILCHHAATRRGSAVVVAEAEVVAMDELRARAHAAAETAHWNATHDALTGLPNRRVLLEALDAAEEANDVGGLILVDLDNFKEINDTLGHPSGDTVLRAVADRLAQACPAGLVTRLGGDEFAIYVSGSAAEVEAIAREARSACSAPVLLDDIAVEPAASLGLAHTDRAGVGDLLRLSDIAMYDAKRGGAGLAWYHRDGDRHTLRRMRLLSELPGAVARGQVSAWFSPVVDLDTGEVIRGEAIPRWAHAEFGPLDIQEFRELVEIAGLHHQVASAAFRSALRSARSWPERMGILIKVAERDVRAPEVAARLLADARSVGVAPERLVVEVASAGAVPPTRVLADAVATLRSGGVSVFLADVGAAQCSLQLLRELQVDGITLDSGLVAAAPEDPTSAAILRLLVGVAAELALAVNAEGVNTSEQADVLRGAGCRVGRGELFGPPTRTCPSRRSGVAALHGAR